MQASDEAGVEGRPGKLSILSQREQLLMSQLFKKKQELLEMMAKYEKLKTARIRELGLSADGWVCSQCVSVGLKKKDICQVPSCKASNKSPENIKRVCTSCFINVTKSFPKSEAVSSSRKKAVKKTKKKRLYSILKPRKTIPNLTDNDYGTKVCPHVDQSETDTATEMEEELGGRQDSQVSTKRPSVDQSDTETEEEQSRSKDSQVDTKTPCVDQSETDTASDTDSACLESSVKPVLERSSTSASIIRNKRDKAQHLDKVVEKAGGSSNESLENSDSAAKLKKKKDQINLTKKEALKRALSNEETEKQKVWKVCSLPEPLTSRVAGEEEEEDLRSVSDESDRENKEIKIREKEKAIAEAEIEVSNLQKEIKETEQSELTDTDCDNDADSNDTRSEAGTISDVSSKYETRLPGRAIQLHDKLSSPARTREPHTLPAEIKEEGGQFETGVKFAGDTAALDRDIILLIQSEEPTRPEILLGKGRYGNVAALKNSKERSPTPLKTRSLSTQTGTTGWKYCEEEIKQAALLWYSSPKTYKLLRSFSQQRYPCPNTIQKYVQRFRCSFGINQEMFFLLSQMLQTLLLIDRNVAMVFDEIALHPHTGYSQHLKMRLPSAKKAMVVMIRGLRKKFKEVIFYDFECSMDMELLSELILQVERAGASVRAVTLDMGKPDSTKRTQGKYKCQTFPEFYSFVS